MSRCQGRGQHPAKLAQAAVTSALLTGGKLEEAVDVIGLSTCGGPWAEL